MRGKGPDPGHHPRRGGITPACAGKRICTVAICHGWRDHPRVCGEKRVIKGIQGRDLGSPPRVRGKGFMASWIACRAGITPACAGKRAPRTKTRRPARDHPRVCGEKDFSQKRQPGRQGSPPRVRGKVDVYYFFVPNRRITPACAGKSKKWDAVSR